MIGQKQLKKALEYKNTSKVIKFIENGLDISGDGNVIKVILKKLNNSFIKLFINHSKNVDYYEVDSHTALSWACYMNNFEIVKCLIEKGANVNLGCGFGDSSTALDSALKKRHFEIAQYLIKKGADITFNDSIGWNALMKAILDNNFKVAKILIKYQAHLGFSDMSYDALIKATSNKDSELISDLLKYGLNVNNQSTQQQITSLHVAMISGYYDIVKLLIENGADVNQRMIDSTTPLMIPISIALSENEATNQQLSIAKILIDNQVDIDAINDSGFTAFMIACKSHITTELIEILIENGANINHTCNNNLTALMCASVENNVMVAKLLLKKGVEKEVGNQDGITALMLASNYDNNEIVKALLEDGADKHKLDNDGFTALDYAEFNNENKIVDLLRDEDKKEKISKKISKIDTNHGIDEENFKKLIDINKRHNPKRLVELLNKFTSEEPLKSTTHAVIKNSEYPELMEKVKTKFHKLKKEYFNGNSRDKPENEKNSIEKSVDIIEAFLVKKDSSGWSSAKLKQWSLENPDDSINNFPISDEATFQNRIESFQKEIELRPDINDFYSFLFNILDERLEGFEIKISEDSERILEETKCFINTKILKEGLVLIAEEIRKKANNKTKIINIIVEEIEEYIDILIIHIGSHSKMASRDILKRIQNGDGTYPFIKKIFLSLCDFSIESNYEGNSFKIDLLSMDGEDKIFTDDTKQTLGFTYKIRIY